MILWSDAEDLNNINSLCDKIQILKQRRFEVVLYGFVYEKKQFSLCGQHKQTLYIYVELKIWYWAWKYKYKYDEAAKLHIG